jgi:competence protein ComEC
MKYFVMAAVVLLVWLRWPAVCPAQAVCVSVLAIGQGDAIYIDTPGEDVLIDRGPDRTVVEQLAKVMPVWDRSIDYLLNTHPDADHINGLIHVLRRYRIHKLLSGGQWRATPAMEAWWGSVVEQQQLQVGDVLMLSQNVSLFIVWPQASFDGQRLDNPNDGSVIAVLEAYGTRMVLTGDASIPQEDAVAELVGDVNLLKVGHHGSAHSTSDFFLSVLQPEAAIVSAGENDYGHPSPEVLARLERVGATTYVTHWQGTVRVKILPEGYVISTLAP